MDGMGFWTVTHQLKLVANRGSAEADSPRAASAMTFGTPDLLGGNFRPYHRHQGSTLPVLIALGLDSESRATKTTRRALTLPFLGAGRSNVVGTRRCAVHRAKQSAPRNGRAPALDTTQRLEAAEEPVKRQSGPRNGTTGRLALQSRRDVPKTARGGADARNERRATRGCECRGRQKPEGLALISATFTRPEKGIRKACTAAVSAEQ